MLKIIWNKISGALMAVILIAIGGIAIFFYGKRKGKEELKSKEIEVELNESIKAKTNNEKRDLDNIGDIKRKLRPFCRDS